MHLGLLHNYIDYENIEKPVQTIYSAKHFYRLGPDSKSVKKYKFQKHVFEDNIWRFQLFGGESETEFLNLQAIEESSIHFEQDKFLKISFHLGDKYIIHKRKVYSSMDFLGDAGGVYGSMMLIGYALQYLFVSNEEPQQLLKYYFKVNEEKLMKATENLTWL